MRRERGPLGLRIRLIVAFGLVALLVSTVFATSTYLLARSYLLLQREKIVTHQAFADADFVRRRLEVSGADVSEVLTAAGVPIGTSLVVRWRGRWYSSSLDVGREALPFELRSEIEAGHPATQRVRVNGLPVMVVGIQLRDVGAQFYAVASLDELDGILRLLSAILSGGALLATVAGVGLGIWASRSVMDPLNRVAGAAAEIAGGRLDTRLPATRDPELATIVGSFNSMVESLQQRIVRDARLAADVSHELRSPLTTLVASVDLLDARRAELSSRSRQVLDLVIAELDRFRRLLDNLLELARSDARSERDLRETHDVGALLSGALVESGAGTDVLSGDIDAHIQGDRLRLDRMFRNLFENAGRHGGGLVSVEIARDDDQVLVIVDDAGPGVPYGDKERIFERFATGRTGRGSSSGTGLGLALAAETAAAHGGSIWCTDRPGGGCRFVVALPGSRDEPS